MMQERNLTEILADIDRSGASTVITPGWMQGRAAFGGLAAALAARGASTLVGPDKSLRSLMVSFVAPAPAGDVLVTADMLREGRNVAQVTAQVMAGDSVCTQVMAAFGSARDTKAAAPLAAFKPEPRDSAPLLDGSKNRTLPPFFCHFDGHWTGGGIPISNRADRRLGMWVRHKTDMSAFPAEKLIALADIPPPIMMAHYNQPVMASSLSWSLEFVVPPQTVSSDWFYLDFTLEAASGGYSQQSGSIFTESGQLVALSRQCMVYFE